MNVMAQADQFEIKCIDWDGSSLGGNNERPLTVYKMMINQYWVWFVGQEIYNSNGCDFKVQISCFGIRRKSDAGSRLKGLRRKFDKSNQETIKQRLQLFFLGPEPKPFPPFKLPKAKCVGVVFEDSWILDN